MSLDGGSAALLEQNLQAWVRLAPALACLPQALSSHAAAFRLRLRGTGLEIGCEGEVRGRPNRGRLRLAPVGDEDLTAIFYRVSAGDPSASYGYGGLAAVGARLRPDQVVSWLDYMASGFESRQAPRGLQPAHQFPVPAGGGEA